MRSLSVRCPAGSVLALHQ